MVGDAFNDAAGPVLAFVLISLLTFIGWGIRRLYKFSNQIQKILIKEMSNGKPYEKSDSTKDIMIDIRRGLQNHHTWAQADAVERNKILNETNTRIKTLSGDD